MIRMRMGDGWGGKRFKVEIISRKRALIEHRGRLDGRIKELVEKKN